MVVGWLYSRDGFGTGRQRRIFIFALLIFVGIFHTLLLTAFGVPRIENWGRRVQREVGIPSNIGMDDDVQTDGQAVGDNEWPTKKPEVLRKECKDSDEHCKEWSSSGECRNNPSYMYSTCKESCGICGIISNNPDPSSSVRLVSGNRMPRIGYGTAGLGPDTHRATLDALNAGYRHIDTAQAPEWYKEDAVGEAIKDSRVSRSQIFITSKLHPRHLGYETTLRQFGTSLDNLGTDYLDLFLLHYAECWGSLCKRKPEGNWRDSWRALEELVWRGKIRDIGVSNFSVKQLTELLKIAKVKPAVVQRNSDVLSQDTLTQNFCKMHGIQYVAYSSLGTQHMMRGEQFNPVLTNPIVQDVAAAHSKEMAQAVLRWALQHDQVVIPRSSNPVRMAKNLDLFSFVLSEEEMTHLDELDRSR